MTTRTYRAYPRATGAIMPGALPQITVLGAPPRGDYELIALTPTGQFWRLPNDLGLQLPSQSVRFHFDRSGP